MHCGTRPSAEARDENQRGPRKTAARTVLQWKEVVVDRISEREVWVSQMVWRRVTSAVLGKTGRFAHYGNTRRGGGRPRGFSRANVPVSPRVPASPEEVIVMQSTCGSNPKGPTP